MTHPPIVQPEPAYARGRWGILALLFFSISINLLDRQVLAVMAPRIRAEFHLTASEYSYIVTAFLIGLTLAQVPAGMFLDRRGARFGLPVIMAFWSVANAMHATAQSLWHFVAFRFSLGVGECGNYSAGVKVISQRFPAAERALAGGLFNSGTVLGAAAAPAILVAIERNWGWRMAFLLPSLLGLLWILPWLAFYRDQPGAQTRSQRTDFWPLLRHRQIWGVMLMRGLAGPVVHFYWNWLPEYLKQERNFSMEMIGQWAGIPFVFAGLGNLAGGAAAAAMMRGGWTADRTRKTIWTAGVALSLASMFVPLVPGEASALAMISVAAFGVAATVPNHIGILTDMFEPKVLAGVTGLAGFTEGVLNITFTLATGAVVDRFSYLPVFLAAGLLPVLALLSLFVLVRKVEPVRAAAA